MGTEVSQWNCFFNLTLIDELFVNNMESCLNICMRFRKIIFLIKTLALEVHIYSCFEVLMYVSFKTINIWEKNKAELKLSIVPFYYFVIIEIFESIDWSYSSDDLFSSIINLKFFPAEKSLRLDRYKKIYGTIRLSKFN